MLTTSNHRSTRETCLACLLEFFLNKISKIRSGLGTQVCAPHPYLCAPHPLDKLFNGKHLLSFTPVSETTVREILNKSALQTCELGAIATDPFHLFESLDTVMPTLTAIMNKSLLSRKTGESLLNFVFVERIRYYSALCFSQAAACLCVSHVLGCSTKRLHVHNNNILCMTPHLVRALTKI